MVFVFELDEADENHEGPRASLDRERQRRAYQSMTENVPDAIRSRLELLDVGEEQERDNPNVNLFSLALACYP